MKLLDTVRLITVPINHEGYPFILLFTVLTLVFWFIWTPLFVLGCILTIWCIYFFRDPYRIVPQDENILVSPADGKVSSIATVIPPAELNFGNDEMTRVSIFMDVFSCHVNRFPIAGTIKDVTYIKGKFLNAELDKASEQNERNAIALDTVHGNIGVVQVAGLIARRIRYWKRETNSAEQGEKFGIICFGSRVDVYMPAKLGVIVQLGQTMVAGETVIAALDSKEVKFKRS